MNGRQRLSAIKSVLTDEHANRLRQIVDSLQNLLAVMDDKDRSEVTRDRQQGLALLTGLTMVRAVLGEVIQVRLKDGAGAWWKADGESIGFLERYTPKK
jgi:hypothetical protein